MISSPVFFTDEVTVSREKLRLVEGSALISTPDGSKSPKQRQRKPQ